MSARADLQALLAATTAVTDLVGDRIAADRIEQTDARPFIVYTTTATNLKAGLICKWYNSSVDYFLYANAIGKLLVIPCTPKVNELFFGEVHN